MTEETKISNATVTRLPWYLRFLRAKRSEGFLTVTSTAIAEELSLHPIQVRKDLALVSSVRGKPKTGFSIEELIRDIEKFLGYDKPTTAVLVGVGGLGKALLAYGGFANYGVRVEAAFDCNRAIAGIKIDGHPVYHISELADYVKSHSAAIGIITVPSVAAQEVCDTLVRAGVRAVWNFAPVALNAPKGIALKNEDLASSLAVLTRELARSETHDA